MLEKVDKHSGVPAYLQIITFIKREMMMGNLKTGSQLPPIREMQEIFGVNVNTVVRSIERLQLENIIDAQQGVGYFIKESSAINPEIVTLLNSCAKTLKEMNVDLYTATVLLEEVWKNA